MDEFTKPRFLALPSEKQHKFLAKLLNEIYRLLLFKKPCLSQISRYETYESWLGFIRLDLGCFKKIADRYHEHMRLSKQLVTEADFLPKVSHFDRGYAETPWPIYTYLDDLRSPHNVGSILRTVEGFGFGTVFFSERTPWITNKQVQKTSQDTYLFVTCEKETGLKMLHKPIIALETAEEATELHQFIFPESFTLCVGNEEYGCSEGLLKAADTILAIPMRGRKNSLNVANAFAAAASEILRQRQTYK